MESAIENKFGVKIDNFDKYLGEKYKLIKLHGSCNWFRKIRIPNSEEMPVNADKVGHHAKRLGWDLLSFDDWPTLDIEVKSLSYDQYVPQRGSHSIFHPQLAIPVNEKSTFICPNKHLIVAEDYLAKTNHLILVGWRANEDHFKDMLKKCIGEREIALTVVNHGDTGVEEVVENMRSVGIKFKNINRFNEGFSAFLSEVRKSDYTFLNY